MCSNVLVWYNKRKMEKKWCCDYFLFGVDSWLYRRLIFSSYQEVCKSQSEILQSNHSLQRSSLKLICLWLVIMCWYLSPRHQRKRLELVLIKWASIWQSSPDHSHLLLLDRQDLRCIMKIYCLWVVYSVAISLATVYVENAGHWECVNTTDLPCHLGPGVRSAEGPQYLLQFSWRELWSQCTLLCLLDCDDAAMTLSLNLYGPFHQKLQIDVASLLVIPHVRFQFGKNLPSTI